MAYSQNDLQGGLSVCHKIKSQVKWGKFRVEI